MLIGHVNLTTSMSGADEHFVTLVERLQASGLRQHVLVRKSTLATRISTLGEVEVGPVVTSPILAYCLMPGIDVAHVHDPAAGQVGLLLALTRSIPFVLTHRGAVESGHNPLLKSIYRRASLVICQDDSEAALLHHWLPGLVVVIVPDVERGGSVAAHLRVYQNSQRMPIAGNNGIQ